MNRFVGIMQWLHVALSLPGVWWVLLHEWCAVQWGRLRR